MKSSNLKEQSRINDCRMLIGKGYFTCNYYCSYVSEQLLRFIGPNAKGRINESVAPQDRKTFEEAFLEAEVTDAKVIYVRICRADQVYRMCRVKIQKNRDNMYELEVIDIDNVCHTCISTMNENQKLRYFSENQGFIFFEYYYENDEILIYSYLDNRKIFITNDNIYHKIKEYIRKDVHTFCEFGTQFSFDKEYQFDQIHYLVKGNVVLRDGRKSEIIGMIRQSQDEFTGQIKHESIHDPATGLYNKPHALMLARKAVNLKMYKQILMIMIDIDNFKQINDSYGHLFGDEVLKQFALIIRESSMNRGFAGRFGGDEFFMLLYDIGYEGDIRAIIQDIYYKFKIAMEGKDISITCSIGVSEYPRNSKNFDELIDKADRALYIAKYKGKNRYILYKEELHNRMMGVEESSMIHMRQSIDKNLLLDCIRDGILKLSDQSSDYHTVEEVFQKVIQLLGLNGISVYTGDKLYKLHEFGSYTRSINRIPYMENSRVLELFSSQGLYYFNTHTLSPVYIEEFHDTLKQHNIIKSIQCILGEKGNMKGLVTYDSEDDNVSWSELDNTLIMLLTNCASRILLQ